VVMWRVFVVAACDLGVDPNLLRYAAATGTVLIRWEGARQPMVWIVPAPEMGPREARLELARRYPHSCGPTTPESFGEWSGIGARAAGAAFSRLGESLTPVRTPIGDAWIQRGSASALITSTAGVAGSPPLPVARGTTRFLLLSASRRGQMKTMDGCVHRGVHNHPLWCRRHARLAW
jgi:Winged helix DNA-binding domain